MISSGRTRSVAAELEKLYGGKWAEEADTDWIWGFDREELQRMLRSRKSIPFRCYIVRYLLAVFETELRPYFVPEQEEGWLDAASEMVQELLEKGNVKYTKAPEGIRAMTDLVVEGAQRNMSIATEGEVPGKEVWGRQAVLNSIQAERVPVSELYKFAFSVNMAYEDIEFFLTKAFKRAKLNLWNEEEFLLYLTFCYAESDCFAFFEQLKKYYAECKPQKYEWKKDGELSTTVVRERIREFADQIHAAQMEDALAFRLNDKGELSEKIKTFLAQYKDLIGRNESYERTINKVSCQLLKEFEKNLGKDEEGLKVALKGDISRVKEDIQKILRDGGTHVPGYTDEELRYYSELLIPHGKVTIQYNPAYGLAIPEGTGFKSINGDWFVSEEEVSIPAGTDTLLDVKIDVVCTLQEEKQTKPDQQEGFVPKKTAFESDNEYLSGLSNKSQFKSLVKAAGAKGKVCVSGAIYGKCVPGKELKAGTRFWAADQDGKNRIEFVSVKDVDTSAYAQLQVRGTVPGTEAVTGEIVSCDISDWEKKFISISNSKIQAKAHERKTEGGALYNYLYHVDPEEYDEIEDILEEEDYELLASVLEGTQLGAAKISNIRTGRKEAITRDNLLTLCFLAYASRIDNLRIENELEGEDAFSMADIQAGFLQKTKEILNQCGCYELYVMNPYDSLLVCMLASNESVYAFKNLWTWYLMQRERREEKKQKKQKKSKQQ